MKLYVVRHGESVGNVEKSYHGSEEMELSEKGIAQVRVLKKKLDNIKFSKIYVSERSRAAQTALLLGYTQIEVTEKLNERGFGIFEGLTFSQIEDEYPLQCSHWLEDWRHYRPDKGESHSDIAKRVFEFMDTLLANEKDDVLLITHAGVMRMIYCYVMDKREELFWKFSCDNCDMAVIKYEHGNLFLDSIEKIEGR
ncbi:histidine phosphatase family protein [Oceanirhabdus seepicola]|uniref:Histidine phosphatase family protein n=1 Tax=Oceanirhabdus seepicola TaxID=2828781 RepID=A0A9J6P1S9_9CLOT|nr:histidine phosphatase family protein [Oceanirhabdus seepicola]MCM1990491.1 histidine phosphatase family protein [Oceanirhabdus seepicola]